MSQNMGLSRSPCEDALVPNRAPQEKAFRLACGTGSLRRSLVTKR